MTQSDAAPVIIRRKKVIAAAGHHGGAWKVAYADFVTAMMAFFLMMWLLSATTEDQRQGLADYFSPEIPISKESGGSRDVLSGDSLAATDSLNGVAQASAEQEAEIIAEIAARFDAESGESDVADRLLRHVKTRVTDEGLVVDIFSLPGAPIFEGDGAGPTPLFHELVAVVDDIFRMASNRVAIQGHVRAQPVVRQDRDGWAVSRDRGEVARVMLADGWTGEGRIARTASFADNMPLHPDRMDVRNDRVELILLRNARR